MVPLVNKFRKIALGKSKEKAPEPEEFDAEVERIYRFHRDVMQDTGPQRTQAEHDIDTKRYVKYLLAEGTIEEKRHILLSLRSKLILKDRKVYLETIPAEAESQ